MIRKTITEEREPELIREKLFISSTVVIWKKTSQASNLILPSLCYIQYCEKQLLDSKSIQWSTQKRLLTMLDILDKMPRGCTVPFLCPLRSSLITCWLLRKKTELPWVIMKCPCVIKACFTSMFQCYFLQPCDKNQKFCVCMCVNTLHSSHMSSRHNSVPEINVL